MAIHRNTVKSVVYDLVVHSFELVVLAIHLMAFKFLFILLFDLKYFRRNKDENIHRYAVTEGKEREREKE